MHSFEALIFNLMNFTFEEINTADRVEAPHPPPFFLDFILERGREREREGNINVWLPLHHPLLGTWPATQAYALTGNRTSGPLVPLAGQRSIH